MDYAVVKDGAELVCGKRRLRVIRTPGHTPGHLTLYEPSLKLYFSGDHILGDITPNIIRWRGVKDSLGDYLASLAAVSALDAALTLPGHRSLIPDMKARIRELELHHATRLDEVRRILRQGGATAYAVASRMTWSLRTPAGAGGGPRRLGWDDFPVSQKWFAMGEALSHLDRLVAIGEAACAEEKGLALFSLTESH
jgi:glyoxylase-like metal-dependent hydrolase (beta-lactamase superfamily II)